jgi:NAD(P)-dependent dehydrogenase (short-subunit alcohol dehydrogenase family)
VSAALAGRTALITGATQGLGLEIARAYLDEGVAGILICGRDEVTLDAALSELTERASAEQKVLGEPADVSRPDDVERLVERALSGLGEITILVSNAGVYGPKGNI